MIRSDNEAKDENEEINEPEIASIPSEERDEDVEEDLQASQDGEEEEGDDAEDAENANEDEDERKWFRTYFLIESIYKILKISFVTIKKTSSIYSQKGIIFSSR